ncbi:prolipoprotein [Mycoplasma feriruminatoris]|uniref:lipoprotein n=1 Tax=Mycoplasma feriruminatoris TaxID=1179777 RepID=UPI00241E9C99|nr:lipoprotein [Mycoplasma feriruminatoris]WFQ91151.1 prolipoprotein [Mycoplasma feriruminatoris]
MKKLVTILGSIGLIATTGITVVACKTPSELKQKLEEPKEDHKMGKQPNSKSNPGKPDEKPSPSQPKNKPHSSETQPRELEQSENNNNSNGHPKEEPPQADEPQNDEPQGGEPRENDEAFKKNNEKNFGLIKKYGEEFNEFLISSEDKLETLNNDENNTPLLKILGNIGTLYERIKEYPSLTDFESKLKSEFDKQKDKMKSFSEFLKDLYEQWDEIVSEYEKEKGRIVELLKSNI